ncbi:peptidyl-prolyl cis-trans isomerase d [Stylonychia lemnae]|uniref:Peptidyl-prolyl cis-trans isomerase d n=1 Tax=Stylonychia lemnae TaxID=5949 RepID=A0A077ZTE0_STYLE|nr:peptidyl-prolyl cis-trans isomerase d [Stylonychia lemnae]|eukprot:CDW73168.1 peptidyl-prolyl cis-trans isomerase d [Stylonychia lemnae]
MGKFERMMKAAVSIKSAELESKRKKFEKLPMFLKAGVYYSTKLEAVRLQDFYPKIFSFEIIRNEANFEYLNQNYDRACRKFEEALSIFRYYICYNPKWQEEGINDNEIREVDEIGHNDYEKTQIRKLKLQMFLNIAACNIKTKDYETAVAACDEALRLDPYNTKALYRRARGQALPINSGVEDFRKALVDLRRVIELDPNNKHSLREIKRLQGLIDINRKREKDTYGKMFTSQSSVSEYVDHKISKEPINYKSIEDQEYEKEKQKMDRKVKKMMQEKLSEFSFEVSSEKKHFKEVDDIQEMIDKAEESYKLFRKTGRMKEAKMIKSKLLEAKFAKEHLMHVMNLDFNRPTQKMLDIAAKNNIDLKDPQVLAEFKKIQQQNLEDIKRMKEGKKPLTDEELKNKLNVTREDSSKYDEAKKKMEEVEKQKDQSVKTLIETTLNAQRLNEDRIKQQMHSDQLKHYLALGGFLIIWMAFIVYSNMQ